MTLVYNGTTYTVLDESTYNEIYIAADSLTAACDIVNAVNGMSSYTFNRTNYSDMVIRRTQITTENGNVTVRIVLRERTDIEKMWAAVQDLNLSEEEAVSHPCLFPDISKVDHIESGCYYIINGVVSLVTEVIEEGAEGQYTSNPLTGGGN